MQRGFEQESLFTISKHAEEFKKKIKVLIDNEDEKMALFKAFKLYHESHNLNSFAIDIKSILNTPKRYPLYRDVRYLINPEDVEEFLKMIPKSPSDGIHIVRIQRTGRDEIGFSIRGGKEHRVGVFVSLVQRGTPADIVGLKAGDEILSVNNMPLTEATHEEVVNLLRSRRTLVLKVKSTGKVPCKILDVIRWEEVEDKENVYYHPDLLAHLMEQGSLSDNKPFQMAPGDKQAFLSVGKRGIGCSVRNGFPGISGLFVIAVTPGSISDKAGIRIGNQIVAVNGKDITRLSYSEAVYMLKSFQEINLILRPSKEAEKFIRDEDSGKNDEEKVPEFAIRTQILLKKAEDKERVEKAKSEMHFQALAHDNGDQNEKKDSLQVDKDTRIALSDMTPNTRKKALFSEGVQVINSATIPVPNEPSSLPASPLNPSNFEFEHDVLKGREAKFLSIQKVSDLGIELEENNGGIFIKSICSVGAVAEHGGIEVGDQLLNVEGTSLLGVTKQQAEQELKEAMNRRVNVLDIVVAKSTDAATADIEVYNTWL